MNMALLNQVDSNAVSDSGNKEAHGKLVRAKKMRQAFFINKSKKSSSISAVRQARLIDNVNQENVKIVKICA